MYTLCVGLMQSRIAEHLELTEEAKTFSWEEFAEAAFSHLHWSRIAGEDVNSENDEDLSGQNITHLGIDAMFLTRIAEKLFSKDGDFEEPPAEKEGEEA